VTIMALMPPFAELGSLWLVAPSLGRRRQIQPSNTIEPERPRSRQYNHRQHDQIEDFGEIEHVIKIVSPVDRHGRNDATLSAGVHCSNARPPKNSMLGTNH